MLQIVDRLTWFLFVATWVVLTIKGEHTGASIFLIGSVLLNVLLRIERNSDGDKS